MSCAYILDLQWNKILIIYNESGLSLPQNNFFFLNKCFYKLTRVENVNMGLVKGNISKEFISVSNVYKLMYVFLTT